MTQTQTAVPIGRIMLPNVRLSFPSLFTAEDFNGDGNFKFKSSFLVPKGSALHKQIDAKILAVAKAKWDKKAESVLKSIAGNRNKMCFQDGDTYEYDGYADHMCISSSNKSRPTVLGRDKSPLTAEDGVVYAGCYVNASIEIFAYSNSGNGISASLRGIQFARDGDAFTGGRPADADEFEEVTEGNDAGDFA